MIGVRYYYRFGGDSIYWKRYGWLTPSDTCNVRVSRLFCKHFRLLSSFSSWKLTKYEPESLQRLKGKRFQHLLVIFSIWLLGYSFFHAQPRAHQRFAQYFHHVVYEIHILRDTFQDFMIHRVAMNTDIHFVLFIFRKEVEASGFGGILSFFWCSNKKRCSVFSQFSPPIEANILLIL